MRALQRLDNVRIPKFQKAAQHRHRNWKCIATVGLSKLRRPCSNGSGDELASGCGFQYVSDDVSGVGNATFGRQLKKIETDPQIPI